VKMVRSKPREEIRTRVWVLPGFLLDDPEVVFMLLIRFVVHIFPEFMHVAHFVLNLLKCLLFHLPKSDIFCIWK
jgi:hypothetical protein